MLHGEIIERAVERLLQLLHRRGLPGRARHRAEVEGRRGGRGALQREGDLSGTRVSPLDPPTGRGSRWKRHIFAPDRSDHLNNVKILHKFLQVSNAVDEF